MAIDQLYNRLVNGEVLILTESQLSKLEQTDFEHTTKIASAFYVDRFSGKYVAWIGDENMPVIQGIGGGLVVSNQGVEA